MIRNVWYKDFVYSYEILLVMLPAILPAILWAVLNMFNFPAILLAIFSYLEGEFDYSLAKTELKC